MVGPTNLLGQVVHHRGNSSPSKKVTENCTKWSFWVQILDLIWLVVAVALLAEITAALVRKGLVQLKFQALLTF